MTRFSTLGILLRRVDFSDYDLIITFFTLDRGKISVLAKAAKKSTKRFAGILELFSALEIVCSQKATQRGLPILQEATMKQPFSKIRQDIKKTAYASYWAELINEWVEGGAKNTRLYKLFLSVLNELDLNIISPEVLSILFQMRFMALSGLAPGLARCGVCGRGAEEMSSKQIGFDLKRGGLICARCQTPSGARIRLSKGAIKELLWIAQGDIAKAKRMRFTRQGVKESMELLEAFVPYHLGKEPRSLKILRQIRAQT